MTAPRKRRWFQFGLSALFVLVTICAVLSSAYRWFFVAVAIWAFAFWRAAYREDSPRLGILVLIGLYVMISFLCMALVSSGYRSAR